MRIDSSGNVGIGTSSPTTRLSISSSTNNDGVLITNTSTANTTAKTTRVGFVGTDTSGTAKEAANIYVIPDDANYADARMTFWTRGSGTVAERMSISSSGDIGIGTASPTKKLDVVGAGAFTTSVDGTTLTVSGGGVGGQSGQILQTNTYAGVPTPNKYLRVDGSGQWQIVNSAYSNTIISITDAGAASQGNNSSTWTVVSDVRIKQNIRPITDALGKICSLNPVHFEYKTRLGKTKTNFIAQEFEQVFPGHVVESAPGMEFESLFAEGETMKSIDADLIPYLVAAIKELKAEINLLKGI